MTNDKIDSIAVTAIQTMCNEMDYLKAHIDIGGTFPTWDGEIHFHPKNDGSKQGLTVIRTQIKGTTKNISAKNKTIMWSANRHDLENYLRNDGGILYFVVTVDKTTKKAKQIYYSDLTAIELTKSLSQNGSNPKISLKTMPNDPKLRLQVFINYMNARLRIFSSSIRNLGIMDENINSMTFMPTGEFCPTGDLTNYINQTVRIVALTKDGDSRAHHTPVQVKKAGGDYDIHFNLGDDAAIFIGTPSRTIGVEVCVNSELFYNSISTKHTDNTTTITIGGFITLCFAISKDSTKAIAQRVNINPTKVKILTERIHALRFIIVSHESGGFEIDGRKLQFDPLAESTQSILDTCKRELESLLKMEQLFQLLQFPLNTDTSKFTEQELHLIHNLISTLIEKNTITLKNAPEHNYTLYTPQLQQYKFALNMIREDVSNERTIKIAPLVDYKKPTLQFAWFVNDESKSYYHPVPIYTIIDPTMLSELSNIDFDDIYKQYTKMPVDDVFRAEIFQTLTFGGLKSCDNGGPRKEELLQLIIRLLQHVMTVEDCQTPGNQLDLLQAYKRQRELTQEERTILFELTESENPAHKIAAHLLLDNKEQSQHLLSKLSQEEQMEFNSFPISKYL